MFGAIAFGHFLRLLAGGGDDAGQAVEEGDKVGADLGLGEELFQGGAKLGRDVQALGGAVGGGDVGLGEAGLFGAVEEPGAQERQAVAGRGEGCRYLAHHFGAAISSSADARNHGRADSSGSGNVGGAAQVAIHKGFECDVKMFHVELSFPTINFFASFFLRSCNFLQRSFQKVKHMSATKTVIDMMRSTLRIAQKNAATPEQRAEAIKAEQKLPDFEKLLLEAPAPEHKPAA